jgi:hypothetical protein
VHILDAARSQDGHLVLVLLSITLRLHDDCPSDSEEMFADQDMITVLLTCISASNFILILRIDLLRLSNDNVCSCTERVLLIKHVLLNKAIVSICS